MSDHLVYLYAVGEASLAEIVERAAITGVDGTPVRTVSASGLTAVVSSVDQARFSEDALQRELEDLHWLEEVARAHHGVVDALARVVPLAPVRLATVYLDDENVRARLVDKATEFFTVLARIRDRTEWGVKAFETQPSSAQPAVASGVGPGTAYLTRRRAERDQAQLGYQRALAAAEELHREICQFVVASRRYPPQDPRLTGQREKMVLNAAYLTTDSAAAELRRLVEQYDSPALRLELTGPWAPYSFATWDES